MTEDDKTKLALLQAALSAAVPLYIEEVKRMPASERAARTRAAGDEIAEHGDLILYRSKKKGGTAKAFNALAFGVAALSFAPGGVTVFELHFEAKAEAAP